MKIVTSEQMRELDRRTIIEAGVPGKELMERAGRGVFEAARSMRFDLSNGVVLLAGKGNNGGDALVVGRYFLQQDVGVSVTLITTAQPSEFSGDPLHHWNLLAPLKPEVIVWSESNKAQVASQLNQCSLVIDGLLGTGAAGEPRGVVRELIELAISARRPMLAIDIPSGLNSDTGEPSSACIRADLTVTIGLPKIGLLQQPALDHVGHVAVVDIGIPPEFVDEVANVPEYFQQPDAFALLSPRRFAAHKGDFGHLLVLAGSEGFGGAPVLASEAAMRCGSGLVTLAIPRNIWPVVAPQCREVMARPFEDWSPAMLEPWIHKCDALAVGPGLGQSDATRSLVTWLLETSSRPLVLDADALNVLAANPALLRRARVPVVLTPHPGEMARLIGKTIQDVQTDRWGVASRFAADLNVVLLLKGARTVVAAPDGRMSINSTGNPGMASGGMGDVLTGIIGSLLGRGLPAYDAVRVGAWLHGLAGDLARDVVGEDSLIASDIIHRLPEAFQTLRVH